MPKKTSSADRTWGELLPTARPLSQMYAAASHGCQDEGLPPVRFLRQPGWLGRARISGEEVDPCDVQAGRTQVAAWHSAHIAHGGKLPARNEYFGLPEDLLDPDDDTALGRAVAAISHLPVVFLTGLYEGEQGLSRTRDDYWGREDDWSIIEAYVRLGILPPARLLSLPIKSDLPRSPKLTAYLMAAYVRAACHQAVGHLRSEARMAQRTLAQLRSADVSVSTGADAPTER
ncbi:hypothetical protein ACFU5O_31995 [Streptomyces sp. NPDC057445]|uniref:hypothetical protein n=1 Tax=Streptomyces sp. NPDC057445 TaxID=3346136 RepID=UPI0036C778BF